MQMKREKENGSNRIRIRRRARHRPLVPVEKAHDSLQKDHYCNQASSFPSYRTRATRVQANLHLSLASRRKVRKSPTAIVVVGAPLYSILSCTFDVRMF